LWRGPRRRRPSHRDSPPCDDQRDGNDDPPDGDDVFAVYLRAKARAEADLRAAGLDHTIVRPGGLSDESGTGKVRIDG
jgi:hypothetical protein